MGEFKAKSVWDPCGFIQEWEGKITWKHKDNGKTVLLCLEGKGRGREEEKQQQLHLRVIRRCQKSLEHRSNSIFYPTTHEDEE